MEPVVTILRAMHCSRTQVTFEQGQTVAKILKDNGIELRDDELVSIGFGDFVNPDTTLPSHGDKIIITQLIGHTSERELMRQAHPEMSEIDLYDACTIGDEGDF